ncbi:MAG: dihydroxyacetone kinase phosphoryl donor subunit DhaM, partial [Cyanobacteriota bacterium]
MARVGIVLVSHSPALAEASLELALAMVPSDPPAVALAAGTADGRLGTDPARVAEAIAEVDSGAGVVMLADLGSALLSAEMALDFSDPSHRAQLVAAPFVEGLVAALVRAAGGAPLEEVAAAAREALGPKLDHLAHQPPVAGESPPTAAATATASPPANPTAELSAPVAQGSVMVVNAGGMHARPAAAIAALVAPFRASTTLTNSRGESADAASPIALGRLKAAPGDRLTVRAVGEDAQQAVRAVASAIAAGFGEERAAPPRPAIPRRGLGVSPGRVCGPVRRIGGGEQPPPDSPPLALAERAAAARALEASRQAVVAELLARASTTPAPGDAMLRAMAAMATDPALAAAARCAVQEEGLNAEQAWWRVVSGAAARYRAAGGPTAERAADLLDLRDRVLRHLREPNGDPAPPRPEAPAIWLAADPSPIDLATLGRETCLGLVSEGGGPTSHAAILARELGIPAVCGARGILALADGTRLLLDGGSGELVVEPDPELTATATHEPRWRPQPLDGAGATADGLPVALLANVGGPRDNGEAVAWGAEGVGLLRTEFCFTEATTEPTVDEQSERYGAILAAWPGRRVVIRTLDAGSDKPLAFLPLAGEPNPALGLRGFRTARRWPQVLTRQLQAIGAAARASAAEVWVMAPMITTVEEAAAFVEQARGVGLERVGV